MVEGTNSNASVESTTESITSSHCGSTKITRYEVEAPHVKVHDYPYIFRDSNVDWRKQIEEEVRRQIRPNHQSAD